MTSKLKAKRQAKAVDERFTQDERFKAFPEAGPSSTRKHGDETDPDNGAEEANETDGDEKFGGFSASNSEKGDDNDVESDSGVDEEDTDETYGGANDDNENSAHEHDGDISAGMQSSVVAGPSSSKDSEKIVKPLTPEALAAFKAKQERTGVVYISRIPPGMRPTKVRHLMSAYGEIGRVYLQQEGVCFTNKLTSYA